MWSRYVGREYGFVVVVGESNAEVMVREYRCRVRVER